jgi:predicted AAA+ superfamily ATPase
MISRNISHFISKTKKSILLLGPRQVGKSTLVASLKPDLTVNLSDQALFLDYASNAGLLEQNLKESKAKTIFIDEIQRLPSLLNTIQYLVDNDKKIKFYLTGSSARKLKRGRANLLPGRIFSYQIGPLVSSELNYEMDTKKCLSVGFLPEMYLSTSAAEARKNLMSYTSTYLREEIQAEALSRNLESFSRFLKSVVDDVSTFVDYSKLAKRAKISRHACARYFEILEDTLVGDRLFPFQDCLESADLIKHPKFFFFDPGVYNGMVQNFVVSSDRIGALSEQLVFSQIKNSALSFDKTIEISTFRTRGGLEIDFICKVDNHVFAIEVKSSDNIGLKAIDSLKAFENYYTKKHEKFIFHMGTKKQKIEGIWCLPWQEGLKGMGF